MVRDEQTILHFINSFKQPFKEAIEFTFYRGQCYWFALILATRFKGDVWFNSKIVHFAARIDGVLYDIYGKIEPGICPIDKTLDGSEANWINWGDFQIDNHDAVEQIVDSCIKKTR